MHRSLWSLTSAGALFIAACTPAARSDTSGDSANSNAVRSDAATSNWSVSLERGACFGTCPMYTVTVGTDGAVRFKGTRFVSDTTEQKTKVAPESVAGLRRQIDGAGFSALPNYVNGEQACGRWHTDAPRVTMTVTDGDKTHTVIHDYGCSDVPPILKTLEQAVDSVAQTAQWMPPGKS